VSGARAVAEPPAKKRGNGGGGAITPLMRQYLTLKAQHQDAFLFFRLGDFYEMFFDDAVKGSALLGLTLTSRNKHDPEPIPMCGVPWHQRDGYVGRLLRMGHKVALCEQLEEPTAAKPLVDRGVTEVLTPGSVTADALLDPGSNNFLAALWPLDDRVGVCLADASTGEVRVAEPAWADAGPMLARARVAEWVTPRTEDLAAGVAARLDALLAGVPGARSPLPLARFLDAPDPASRWIGAAAAAVAGLEAARRASAAALAYLDRVQGRAALQLTRVERWSDDQELRYDAATTRHLELFQPQPGGEAAHTLWHHVNRAVTPLGARRLRAWLERPLARLEPLRLRHDAVAAFVDAGAARAGVREALRALPDLERLAARLACGKATPRDLGALRDALAALPAIRARSEGASAALLGAVREAIETVPELESRLRAALVDEPPPLSRDGGVIRPGYDADRDGLYDLAHSGKRWIAELEATERARTGIATLKVGFNRVFGYYLEVTRPHLDKVPADWERRQTLTTAERFVTPALKVREGEVLSAEERCKAREHELFVALRDAAAEHVPALQSAAAALGVLDALATLAEIAAQYGWTRPEMDDSDRVTLDAARHPVVDRLLPRGEFVPNGCALDGARRQILLLTGPNMGGKSTYLRQVALAVVLAQAGSFVPAKRAEIGIVDRLFTRVGAADRLGSGQSTFMVEMSETAEIMRSATPRSLVVLDEVGRGTATYDGLAIAWAVVEHLHDAAGPRPRTLFATHYHELTQLAERLPRLANVKVLVEEAGGQVVFLHRIADGAADRSYGIHVAERAGLPPSVIARAREVLAELERERTVEHLEPAAARRVPEPQLGLFATAEHPLVGELRALDLDRLTPLEALQRLNDWKQRT
jgi:DNA mismatch repair protein MutS